MPRHKSITEGKRLFGINIENVSLTPEQFEAFCHDEKDGLGLSQFSVCVHGKIWIGYTGYGVFVPAEKDLEWRQETCDKYMKKHGFPLDSVKAYIQYYDN